MPTSRAREGARDRLVALNGARLGFEEYCRTAAAELRRALGFDAWWITLSDPGAHLATQAVLHDPVTAEHLPRLADLELTDTDLSSMHAIGFGEPGVGVLSAAARGDLAHSRRWDEVYRAYGLGDELRAVLRRNGQHWGSMQLTREHTDRDYGDDAAFVRDVAPLLADGLRRSLVATPPAAAADSAPGVLLLDADRCLVASTPAAERWLARLDGRSVPAGLPGPTRPLPFPVTVGAHAQGWRALTPHTQVRAPDGTWTVVSAAPLSGSPPGRIAITVQCASPTAVLPLLEAAYGLTRRERQVSRLVLEGLGTTEIARRLAIGDYTVQDHLKAVFAKVGVRSRTALAAAFLLPAPAPPPLVHRRLTGARPP